MKQNGNPHIFVSPIYPDTVFAQFPNYDYIVFNVLDATSMDENEVLKYKTDNPNHATTEAAGRYFVLTIVEASMQDPPDDDILLAKQVNKVQLSAAEFWHNHILANQN